VNTKFSKYFDLAGRADEHRKWSAAVLCAVISHVLLILAISAFSPSTSTVETPETPLQVSILHESPSVSPRKAPPRIKKIVPLQRESTQLRRLGHRAVTRTQQPIKQIPATDIAQEGPPERSKQSATAQPMAEDLSTINFEPSPMMLFEAAGRDPRIRRRTRQSLVGLFDKRPQLQRYNLPPKLKYRKIKRLIAATWKPAWDLIKDDGISKVSAAWVRKGITAWLGNWQRQLQKQQRPATDRPLNSKDMLPLKNRLNEQLPQMSTIDFGTNPQLVSVLIDAEPMTDGSWIVSIAQSSRHPFFDQYALDKMEETAKLFPQWPEGYGSAVRYRLEARFVIIPPSTSSIIGLNCAFPFCTLEELKNLEVTHWFKKLVDSKVYFEGLVTVPEETTNTAKTIGNLE